MVEAAAAKGGSMEYRIMMEILTSIIVRSLSHTNLFCKGSLLGNRRNNWKKCKTFTTCATLVELFSILGGRGNFFTAKDAEGV